MKNSLKQIFFPPVMLGKLGPISSFPKPSPEQEFRFKTVDDIAALEGIGKKELAALEAKKLIEHLKSEFGL